MVTINVLQYYAPLGVPRNTTLLRAAQQLFLSTYVYLQLAGVSILLKNYFLEFFPPTFCGSFYLMVSKKYPTDQYMYLAFNIMEVPGLGDELRH